MSHLEEIIKEYCLVSKEHADALGEILRAWAFVGEGYGCYSNFKVRPEFEKVEPTVREFKLIMGRPFSADTRDTGWGDPDSYYMEAIRWYKHPSGIEMGWIWDGDGLLAFYVPELEDEYYNGVISNSDCKKDSGWNFDEKVDFGK